MRMLVYWNLAKGIFLLRKQKKFGTSSESKNVVFSGIYEKSSSSINSVTSNPVFVIYF